MLDINCVHLIVSSVKWLLFVFLVLTHTKDTLGERMGFCTLQHMMGQSIRVII
jgi:hypothetical protein